MAWPCSLTQGSAPDPAALAFSSIWGPGTRGLLCWQNTVGVGSGRKNCFSFYSHDNKKILLANWQAVHKLLALPARFWRPQKHSSWKKGVRKPSVRGPSPEMTMVEQAPWPSGGALLMPPELRPGCPQPGLRSGLLGQRRGGRCGARVQHRHWLGRVLSFPRVCPEGGGILAGAVASGGGAETLPSHSPARRGVGPPTIVCWGLLVA